ncbi:TolC family protein [Neotabrizicola sp. VNH66]|uniref:TolC family protein n=1 Tax=Neotabrizicola sp. VNH66 TaxID=3400918 RepID=UPI003BFEAC65
MGLHPVIRRAGGLLPLVPVLCAALALSGCMGGAQAGKSAASPADLASQPELSAKGDVRSPLIADLTGRRSILPAGSAFALVAEQVLRAGAASAESELRIKRLTAQARAKNWLPRIGPDVSLSSLGAIAAQLLLDQALFDNGRRKAERDFAAADVEVAAVSFVTDLNQRVYDGLKLYLEAQRAAELARISETGLTRMKDFERIMRIRMEGGLSDPSELHIITQKRAEMEATLSSEREGQRSAMAELNTLSAAPLDGVKGLSALPPDAGAPEALSVLLARGDAARTLAEVRMARSGFLPGLGASASVDKGGGLDAGLSLDGDVLSFDRKDKLRALAETEEMAVRKVDEARREADRRIVALDREIAALQAQAAQEGKVLAEMETNLSLFTEQYEAGRRTLIELAGQFEALVRLQRSQASVKYQIALARLEIALVRGVLVDGASM